ncbi:MAG: MBL fold metallo-hydrolase [Acidobacteria bacterium]|jgi:L-ascorbate metabolism protein UlaG (beta-lactamase superfamily)|nr:MBL fold metallo-hydrolase [Acidobacteriota bacterium]MBA4123002.1 MBL fold metallo-hydrolase [Acidobacteriota bacterium]MBA4183141.1 MBL fold metallo-hydrolase [Acidobacteriota bacterium]
MSNTFQLSASADSNTDFNTGSVFFVGTATVILRYAGFTILTDPNFLHAGDHVHLGYGLTSERLTEPAINIEDLPPVDLCVLSHYHGDHFDQIVEEKLDKNLPIVTTNHAVGELEARDFRGGIGLDTWETAEFTKGEARLRITSLPGKHGPAMVDFALPDVMGSILDFETGTGERLLRLYISGDTLIFDDLKEIPNRFPEIDLALIHLGGTRILGVMLTMDDKQGVEIIQLVRPEKVIPIHYNDYDVFKSPLEDFKRAVEEAGLTEKLIYLSHGETYNFEIPSSRRMKTSG